MSERQPVSSFPHVCPGIGCAICAWDARKQLFGVGNIFNFSGSEIEAAYQRGRRIFIEEISGIRSEGGR